MTHDDFIDGMERTIHHIDTLEKRVNGAELRAQHLETVLKLVLRRMVGRLYWGENELLAASKDERCVVIGGRDCELM